MSKPNFEPIRKVRGNSKGDKPTGNPTQPPGTFEPTDITSSQAITLLTALTSEPTADIANPSSSSHVQASSSQAIAALAPPPVPAFDAAPPTMLGTPVPSQDSSRRLNCLIEGESIVFVVTVGRNCVVSDLKEVIQNERALDTLKDIGPHTLELWKPKDSSPIPAESADTSLRDGPSKFADKLDPTDSVFSLFPEKPPREHIHIIVKVPATEWFTEPSKLGKRSRDDLSALQEKQTKRYRTGENPSTVCKDAKLMRSRQDYAEILNGRPWTSSGPPVGLYHPIFDRFLAYFEESTLGYRTASSVDSDNTMPSIDDAFSLMRALLEFYEVKRSGQVDESPPTGRVEAILPAFSRLLGITLPGVENTDGTELDARATAKTPAGDDGPLAVVEIKLELGIAGDGNTQAQQSYARMCSLPEHEPVRLSSCSPCFLVDITGPWITVLGAVYVQKVIVQRLAGPIYLPPQHLHPYSTIDIPLRLFCALRRALRDLRQYYEQLSRQKTFSRFFPFVRSYKLPSGVTMNLDYIALLSPDDSRAIYLARQADGREVVVKFSSTYNARAHRLLADHGLAPELIYDGTEAPRYGGLLMIVMDHVKGGTLSKFLHSSPHQNRLDAVATSVRKAIALLHAENLVFGDLRMPNILVDDDDNVKLIDYDWCGVHQVDRYPFIVGDAIQWASGVGPLATMHKDHDLYMLKGLEANIRAGAWGLDNIS